MLPSRITPEPEALLSRRSLVIALGVNVTLGNVAAVSAAAAAQDQSHSWIGVDNMQKDVVNELTMHGSLLVVAQWEAKPGEAEKIADILRRFLPQAQSEPGVKLFLISGPTTIQRSFYFTSSLRMRRPLPLIKPASISKH